MTFAFQHHHGAMLLKYSGISFISGAVNHGFFSGERSLWTAAIGMALFVGGALLEHRLSDSTEEPAQTNLLRTLGLGALLSIGLGFFTGGLQHFPDSPARSAWVVPLGFVISVLALSLSSSHVWRRSTSAYVLVVGALVGMGSYGAWQWLEQHPEWAGGGHSHGHDDAMPSHAAEGLQSWVIQRSLEVRMDDNMRFTPSRLDVQAGEVVRLVVHNDGKTAHEMVLGDPSQIQAHALEMQKGAGHSDGHGHGTGAAMAVPAGQRGELVVKFDHAQTLEMACLIPGHYEAGMRGTVHVQNAPVQRQPAASPSAHHDHSHHKH